MSRPDPNFIWSIADMLRGPYRHKEFGTVILPFTILARFDAVLADTKQAVLGAFEKYETAPGLVRHEMLKRASGQSFYNTSPFTLKTLGDPTNLAANLQNYVEGFNDEVQVVFERFNMASVIDTLDERERLTGIVQKFAALDVHPDRVSNAEMGDIFEELIRRFMESSKDLAGDYFTPREVIRLMVSLLFAPDTEDLSDPHLIRQVYDPTCGTGGMLSEAHSWLRQHNGQATLNLFGQEFNPLSFAMAKADLIIKNQDSSNIYFGDTLLKDGHEGKTFSYCLANPPFGQEWKVQQQAVRDERERDGEDGRFAAGLPSVNDGALLFLQHLVSKLRPAAQGGGRGAIVLNGSPLFTGGAGEGPSEVRRHLLENDLVDAIIGLPNDLFYNTGIATYIWVLDNAKSAERKGKVQLIDATAQWEKMRKSIGSKRRYLSEANMQTITHLYGQFEDADPGLSKVLRTEEFGYRTITVEQPLRQVFSVDQDRIEKALSVTPIKKMDKVLRERLRAALERMDHETVWTSRRDFDKELGAALVAQDMGLKPAQRAAVMRAFAKSSPEGELVTNLKGEPEPDPSLRDTENVPLTEDIDTYVAREVLPWAPEAWVNHTRTKVGYEIPFTRVFYKYVPPRPLAEIDADVQAAIARVQALFAEVKA
ncbi:SAM-dependent DNA methyltransferase [Arachnia propionica]|uniref:type I restriction-modification system subunit M n=1 Tax=Arachnia propionica TaxID=1750 RepID=UPI001BA4FD18|nr:class I SAM-dependent DNA methyltransferase [Arachnia propionica]QUC13884.1 SAM-dependent DNA methyltransferase [Arachnia propionica]